MKIASLNIHHLELPFRFSFSHASKTRKKTDSVIVVVKSGSGITGYGEGCPREYVTGETWETAKHFFTRVKNDVQKLETLKDLKGFITTNEEIIDKNPAAWCAIELAILDALAREKNVSIEKLLSLPQLSGEFAFTAVIGTKHIVSFLLLAIIYRLYGFTDFKIKIFGDEKNDKKKKQILLALTRDKGRIRMDANNHWSVPEIAVNYIERLHLHCFGIEEPLKAYHVEGLSLMSSELNTNIILDESFLRFSHFNDISRYKARWVINVRISKMGGLIRSLAICEEARKRKIPIIIGAHVGETSILTRAALAAANAYRDILIAEEGAFGTYLLKKDITDPSIRFTRAGKVYARDLSNGARYGFGLEFTDSFIESLGD